MRCAPRPPLPLAATALAMLTATVGCTTAGGTSSSAASSATTAQGAIQIPNPLQQGTPAQPGLYAVRPFDLSPIVVDEQGMALYRYDKDSPNPSTSVCAAACAERWQPVRPKPGMQLQGVNQSAVSSMTRDDGSDQLTLGGWPLYRYVGDQMPGQLDGMGKDNAWFPVSPTGEKVQAVADPGQSNAFGL